MPTAVGPEEQIRLLGGNKSDDLLSDRDLSLAGGVENSYAAAASLPRIEQLGYAVGFPCYQPFLAINSLEFASFSLQMSTA